MRITNTRYPERWMTYSLLPFHHAHLWFMGVISSAERCLWKCDCLAGVLCCIIHNDPGSWYNKKSSSIAWGNYSETVSTSGTTVLCRCHGEIMQMTCCAASMNQICTICNLRRTSISCDMQRISYKWFSNKPVGHAVSILLPTEIQLLLLTLSKSR